MYQKRNKFSDSVLLFVLFGITVVSTAFLLAGYTTFSETFKATLTSIFLSVAIVVFIQYKAKNITKHLKFFYCLVALNIILVIYSLFFLLAY